MVREYDQQSLTSILQFVMRNYQDAKSTRWNSSAPVFQAFDKDLKVYFQNQLKEKYPFITRILPRSGSSGKWSDVPYCVFLSVRYNNTMTGTNASSGFYPAYLLSQDSSEVYLVYMLASNSKTERRLINQADVIRNEYEMPGYDWDYSKLKFGSDRHRYAVATIWYKTYPADNIPEESILLQDLFELLDFHENNGLHILDIIKTGANKC